MSNFATKSMPIRCPYCSFQRSWVIRRHKRKCKRCRREFSHRRYPVADIRSTQDDWERCIDAFLRQRTILAVTRETGIGRCRTVAMLQQLRTCMTQDVATPFRGPIELDETYIGGQRKNKRLHIRRIQAKRGHGTDKLPIVGLFDRSTGQVLVLVEPRKLDMHFVTRLLREQVVAGASVYTDGFKMYRMLPRYGFHHHYVDHDGGELVRGSVHTNNIEGFWGILKRKLSCIGGVRQEKLPLFVGEICWRFNHRQLNMEQQKECLLQRVLAR